MIREWPILLGIALGIVIFLCIVGWVEFEDWKINARIRKVEEYQRLREEALTAFGIFADAGMDDLARAEWERAQFWTEKIYPERRRA